MKASELMIGNYVIDLSRKSNGFEDYIVVVSDISDRQEIRARNLKSGQASVIRDMLVGIPLTEEWLVKLGFVADGNNFVLYLSDYSGLTFSGGKMYLTSGQFAEMTETVPCDYVHQLQNLYFALTGEELTIK